MWQTGVVISCPDVGPGRPARPLSLNLHQRMTFGASVPSSKLYVLQALTKSGKSSQHPKNALFEPKQLKPRLETTSNACTPTEIPRPKTAWIEANHPSRPNHPFGTTKHIRYGMIGTKMPVSQIPVHHPHEVGVCMCPASATQRTDAMPVSNDGLAVNCLILGKFHPED